MEKVRKEIYEGIYIVSSGLTDFEAGFDQLFEFMAANPDSKTTRQFIDYHILEMGDPRLPGGMPHFGYLIGRHFVVYEWVHKEDRQAFECWKYWKDVNFY